MYMATACTCINACKCTQCLQCEVDKYFLFNNHIYFFVSDLCELRDQNEIAGEEVEDTKENVSIM